MKPYVFIDKKKSPYYQLLLREKGKVLLQQTLRTTDQTRAWQLACIVSIAYIASAEQRLAKTGLRKILTGLYKLATTEDWELFTIREYLNNWKNGRYYFVSGTTRSNQLTAVGHFEEFMDEKLDMLLEDLKPMHIRDWLAYLMERAAHTAPSANSRVEVLSSILGDAVQDGLIETNPCTGVRAKIRKSKLQNQTFTYFPFTYDHLHELVMQGIAPDCNPEMAITSLVACDLGGRVGDMFALVRGDFTLSDSLVVYHIHKVTRLHDVLLFPPTVALLKEYFDHHLPDTSLSAPLAPTFYVPNDDSIDDEVFAHAASQAGTYFGIFLTALGIRPPTPPRVINGKADYDHSFHSFRPTVSTALKLAGISTEVVMARMPHKSEDVNKKYDRFTVQNVCQRVFEGVGLPVPAAVKEKASVTMKQIFELMELARKRLEEFRGKLDLHNGTLKRGQKSWRAKLIPASSQVFHAKQRRSIVRVKR